MHSKHSHLQWTSHFELGWLFPFMGKIFFFSFCFYFKPFFFSWHMHVPIWQTSQSLSRFGIWATWFFHINDSWFGLPFIKPRVPLGENKHKIEFKKASSVVSLKAEWERGRIMIWLTQVEILIRGPTDYRPISYKESWLVWLGGTEGGSVCSCLDS